MSCACAEHVCSLSLAWSFEGATGATTTGPVYRRVLLNRSEGDDIEEYRPPKLIGKKAPLHCLVLPDQHYTAWKATQRYNMSFGEYVGALIDRAEGRPNKLEGMQQGALPIEKS